MIRIHLSTRLGERKWTQADLARMTGIRPNTINEYFHEIAERVSIEHLNLICNALNIELGELLVYKPDGDNYVGRMRNGLPKKQK